MLNLPILNLSVMKKYYSLFKLPLTAVMGVALLFSSCIDQDYDISNGIVADGTLFENAAAPIGNVDKITIDKLLFSENNSDSGISYNSDGDLYIDFAGGDASVAISIEKFEIPGIDLESQNIAFNIPEEIAGLPTGMLGTLFPVVKYSDVVDGGLSFAMDLGIDSDLPEGIDAVAEVDLDAELQCKFSVNQGIMYVSEGFEFIFPDFLEISSAASSDIYEVVASHIVRFKKDAVLSKDSPIALSLDLNRITVAENAVKTDYNGTRKIEMDGSVKVEGDFYIKTADYQTIPENLNIVIDINSNEIAVTEVLASLETEVEIPDEDIIVGELPELFSGKNVCVDLYNPVISLALENGSPFDFALDADITAYNASGIHNIHIGSDGVKNDNYVDVPAGASKSYHFSRRKMTTVPSGDENIVIPALGDLITEIPDRVSIHDMNVAVENGMAKVKTGTEYKVAMAYSLSSPLAFGEELYLSFTEDIKDLNLKLDMNIKSAELDMVLVNSVPVDFDITAVCLDAYGNEDPQTRVYIDKTIAAGSHVSPTSTPVVLKIENGREALDVSSLRLTMTATSVNPDFHGVCLNRNQGLEINDIVLRLPDGIGVKLNK